jgi:hypothetical protein
MLGLSSANPIFLRKDTASNCCWRIRNLPYPVEVCFVCFASFSDYVFVCHLSLVLVTIRLSLVSVCHWTSSVASTCLSLFCSVSILGLS